MVMKIIYTLDARDHAMLEVMRDYFNLPSKRMRNEIQGMLAETQKMLSSKGIKYGDLKSVLVPNPKRREIALVFDTSVIEESWYSLPIHTTLMPLFSKRSNHSILVGDYIGDNEHQERLYEAFFESVQLVRDVTWRHTIGNFSLFHFITTCLSKLLIALAIQPKISNIAFHIVTRPTVPLLLPIVTYGG